MLDQEETVQYMSNAIVISFQVIRKVHRNLNNEYITIAVDSFGYVEFPYTRDYQRMMEQIDVLIEYGFAEWKPIGPEDAEVFLTDEAMALFADKLQTGPEWHEWKVPE